MIVDDVSMLKRILQREQMTRRIERMSYVKRLILTDADAMNEIDLRGRKP